MRQILDQRRGDVVARSAPADGRLECAAHGLGDLEQRSQRARREERIADASQDPRLIVDLDAEPVDEGRLADPGLPGDEQHPALAHPRLGKRLGQHLELALALEQTADFGFHLRVRMLIVHTRGGRGNPARTAHGTRARIQKARPAGTPAQQEEVGDRSRAELRAPDMEHLWSRAGATGSEYAQSRQRREPL